VVEGEAAAATTFSPVSLLITISPPSLSHAIADASWNLNLAILILSPQLRFRR